jgi:hypothetical protein
VRDHRGVPLFGWIAGLEAAQTDFVVHFDSDLLLHQAPGHSWIDAGMALIQEDPLAMFVSPLPGPPASDGSVKDQAVAPTLGRGAMIQSDKRRLHCGKPQVSFRSKKQMQCFFGMMPIP